MAKSIKNGNSKNKLANIINLVEFGAALAVVCAACLLLIC